MYRMMNEVYARLNEVNSMIGKRETSLSTVYDLLCECDEIVKKMLMPENYEPVVENVIVPVPEPTKPKPEPVQLSVKPKKKNPWIEFLQMYALQHNIPYHQALKVDGIQEKYKQHKNNSYVEPAPVPVPEPVVVPEPVSIDEVFNECWKNPDPEPVEEVLFELWNNPVSMPKPEWNIVMEELKTYQEHKLNDYDRKVKSQFAFVLLELRSKLIIKDTDIFNFNLKGRIYRTVYVRNTYKQNVKLTASDEDKAKILPLYEAYLEAKNNHNEAEKILNANSKERQELRKTNWNAYISEMDVFMKDVDMKAKEQYQLYSIYVEAKKKVRLYFRDEYQGKVGKYNHYGDIDNNWNFSMKDDEYSTEKTKMFNVPFRQLYSGFNYQTEVIDYRSILNLKFWHPITKKTTNKGLKATHLWTSYRSDEKSPWIFGGLKADDLQRVCEANGYKTTKNTQYGDYAQWFIKL